MITAVFRVVYFYKNLTIILLLITFKYFCLLGTMANLFLSLLNKTCSIIVASFLKKMIMQKYFLYHSQQCGMVWRIVETPFSSFAGQTGTPITIYIDRLAYII